MPIQNVTAYALQLWIQTLLALASLGLAGGCALWPIRSSRRPYLCLASPLAGITALGGLLIVLYYGVRLPFGVALISGWLLLSSATVACLVFGGVWKLPLKETVMVLAVITAGSIWGTYTCNWTAMQAGEPTIAITEGSDMFGYAMTADWLLRHPAIEKPLSKNVFENFPYTQLYVECSRPVAFLLLAAAAFVRGTTALFSYDWACGVILAAAAIGFAGLFAARPVGLLLLLLTAISSAWMTDSRSGYLGKTLAYPACLLLGVLFFNGWRNPSRARILIVFLIALPTAFLINPIVPLVYTGLLWGGVTAALILSRLRGLPVLEFSSKTTAVWPVLFRGLVLWLGATVPVYAIHRLFFEDWLPPYQRMGLNWDFVIPVSLDLENTGRLAVGTHLSRLLVAGFFVTTLLLLVIAVRRRNILAQGCLVCSALVPLAWLLGQHGLYGFHGILYPLTMAGAALLLNDHHETSDTSSRPEVAVTIALASMLVALHVPQIYQSSKLYLARSYRGMLPFVYRRSEIESIRKRVGDNTVDVSMFNFADSFTVITELACSGSRIILRSPAWDATFKDWQGPSSESPPKGRFSIVETKAFTPPGSVRYEAGRMKLCEDSDTVTFVAFHEIFPWIAWDERNYPGFSLGGIPITIDINNGTRATATVHFQADAFWSGNPDSGQHTLHCRLSGLETDQVLKSPEDKVDVGLSLTPGLNQLTIWVDTLAKLPIRVQEQPRLLRLTRLNLETSRPGGTPDSAH